MDCEREVKISKQENDMFDIKYKLKMTLWKKNKIYNNSCELHIYYVKMNVV